MRKEENARVENLRPLRFNAVWLVPILALIVAGWMVYDNWAKMGEEIVLVAESAEGIEAGKTKVKVHNVEVGEVQDVRLSDDFKQALITVRMKQGTHDMLHSDAKFWVVKPRVGVKGVSGLGTVLSGAYIEMEPGRKGERITRFKVMPQPPLSTSEDKGIRLRLKSKDMAKMDIGTPVHFRGYEVGHIEKADFDVKTGAIKYRIFIQAPYDSLVNDAVQFWLTPGFSVKGSARGIEVRVDSLETLFWGGISFGLTKGRKPGKPVSDLSEFRLYESREVAIENQFKEAIDYVFLFNSGISGLDKGAPVEYSGVRVGTVKEVPYSGPQGGRRNLLQQERIPVLASIEPHLLEPNAKSLSPEYWREYLKNCIDRGLRASLKTSSYITGAQVVDLYFPRDPEPANPGKWHDQPVFPTVEKTGVEEIKNSLSAFLHKLNSLKLETALADLNSTLDASGEAFREISGVSRSLRELIDDPSTRGLPQRLDKAIHRLDTTLSGYEKESLFGQQLQQDMQALERLLDELRPFVRELREQPNMLIFDRERRQDRIPPKAEREND